MESMLVINPQTFKDYPDPMMMINDFLRDSKNVDRVDWNPILSFELTDLRAWSRDYQAFTKPHLRATIGGNSVCVKKYAAGDATIKDEVARLWRVRGSGHVLKFHGIVVKERDTYLVFDAPKFTLEEFWKIDKNPAWQIKMKHIRDLVGGIAFIHSLGLVSEFLIYI
jgi:hypothetical protein